MDNGTSDRIENSDPPLSHLVEATPHSPPREATRPIPGLLEAAAWMFVLFAVQFTAVYQAIVITGIGNELFALAIGTATNLIAA